MNAQISQSLSSAAAIPGLSGSALARLRLDADDFAALRGQGFVRAEWRGHNLVYKLRFRRAGRLIVRHLASEEIAEQVARELDGLQQPRRQRGALLRLAAAARRALREQKHLLQPVLAKVGRHYHGLEIRKRRKPRTRDINEAMTG